MIRRINCNVFVCICVCVNTCAYPRQHAYVCAAHQNSQDHPNCLEYKKWTSIFLHKKPKCFRSVLRRAREHDKYQRIVSAKKNKKTQDFYTQVSNFAESVNVLSTFQVVCGSTVNSDTLAAQGKHEKALCIKQIQALLRKNVHVLSMCRAWCRITATSDVLAARITHDKTQDLCLNVVPFSIYSNRFRMFCVGFGNMLFATL